MVGGGRHTLALKPDGTLWAAGNNSYGQLGDGTRTYRFRFVPVSVGDPSVPVTRMAAGFYHSMALKADGTLWAAGDNESGQLGDGTKISRSTFVPVNVGDPSVPVTDVAAGAHHTLALKADGTVWGTGLNGDGQLGTGDTAERHAFVQVLSGVSRVVAGYAHTIALKTDGTLWATGWNGRGQLGTGGTEGHLTFVQVSSGVSSIASGAHHTLMVRVDGALWATGFNAYGQLGDGTTTDRRAFVQVLSGVSSAAAGYGHSVAVKADGTLWVAGWNAYGQRGTGDTTDRLNYVEVLR